MPMRLVCFALISWFIKSIVANKKQIPLPDPKKWRHPIPPKTSWGDLSNIFSFPPRNGFLSLHPPPKRKKLFLNCTSNNNNYIKCDSLELEKKQAMLESGLKASWKTHNLPVPPPHSPAHVARYWDIPCHAAAGPPQGFKVGNPLVVGMLFIWLYKSTVTIFDG